MESNELAAALTVGAEPPQKERIRRAIYLLNSDDGGYAAAMRILKELAGMDTSGDDLLDATGSMSLAEAGRGPDREFQAPEVAVGAEPPQQERLEALKPWLKHLPDCGAHQPPYSYCSCGLNLAYGVASAGAERVPSQPQFRDYVQHKPRCGALMPRDHCRHHGGDGGKAGCPMCNGLPSFHACTCGLAELEAAGVPSQPESEK